MEYWIALFLLQSNSGSWRFFFFFFLAPHPWNQAVNPWKFLQVAAMRRVKWHDEITHSSMDAANPSMDDKLPRMGCNTVTTVGTEEFFWKILWNYMRFFFLLFMFNVYVQPYGYDSTLLAGSRRFLLYSHTGLFVSSYKKVLTF